MLPHGYAPPPYLRQYYGSVVGAGVGVAAPPATVLYAAQHHPDELERLRSGSDYARRPPPEVRGRTGKVGRKGKEMVK